MHPRYVVTLTDEGTRTRRGGEGMFRCPTCIAVLPDPATRRCHTCRQRLRRRRPRVLGEEHRIGAKLLPIDRALNERLRTTTLTFASPPTSGLRNPWRSGAAAAIPPLPEIDTPPAASDVEANGHAEAPAAPRCEPMRVGPGRLDPDVQALVDDLYRRAREEIAGSVDAGALEERTPDAAAVPASDSQPTRRRGWVPAVLADRKRNEAPGNGSGADH